MPDVTVTVTTGTPVTVQVASPATNNVNQAGGNASVTVENQAAAANTVEIASQDATVTVQNPGSAADQVHSIEKFSGAGGTGYTTLTSNQMSGATEIPTGYRFKASTLILFKNGILMEKDSDYSEAADREGFTLLVAVEASDKIEGRYVRN